MRKIVSRRGQAAPDITINTTPLPEVDFEFDLADDELDTSLGPAHPDPDDGQQVFEYYHEDWVIQGKQAFDGLRMVDDMQALQRAWDCYYNTHIQAYVIRTPNRIVTLTDLFVQSLSMPIRQFVLDTMKP